MSPREVSTVTNLLHASRSNVNTTSVKKLPPFMETVVITVLINSASKPHPGPIQFSPRLHTPFILLRHTQEFYSTVTLLWYQSFRLMIPTQRILEKIYGCIYILHGISKPKNLGPLIRAGHISKFSSFFKQFQM